MSRIKKQVVHITPHLGGGVGKALFSLAHGSKETEYDHVFLLLEKPVKTQFLKRIQNIGCKVFIQPGKSEILDLIAHADIIQIEWWNHPVIFKFLCENQFPPMRLLIWCHQSGLFYPFIPIGLVQTADRFIFTSSCSLKSPLFQSLSDKEKSNIFVVSSGTGLEDPLPRIARGSSPIRVSYIGTLSFSKLHPEYIHFLNQVHLKNFSVTLYGDVANLELLQEQCKKFKKPDLIKIAGFTPDIRTVLAASDIFAYILNPTHYGTAENSLLEAMSAGVVPIVLNNPCEKAIIENGINGIIIGNPVEFAEAIERLSSNFEEWSFLSLNATQHVKRNYHNKKMAQSMIVHYLYINTLEKKVQNFRKILGNNPKEWFLSCHRKTKETLSDIERLYGIFNKMDRKKGSLSHFLEYFPEDRELREMERLSIE